MTSNIELPTVECPKCHHRWIPRTPNPQLCPHCNKRLQRGEEGHRRPILTQKSGTSHGMWERSKKRMIDPDTILTSDLEQMKKNAQADRDQDDEDEDVIHDHWVTSEVCGVGGGFTLPTPMLEQKIKQAANFNANQLKQEIEIIDAEIEKRQEAKVTIAETYQREKLEEAMWYRKPVTIISKQLGPIHTFNVESWEKLEELIAQAAEMQEVMDNRIVHYTKLREAYASQLLKLTETTPKVIAKKLCEINAIIKQAHAFKPFMVKMCAAYRKKGIVSDKDADKYRGAHDRYSGLQRQYSRLYTEISHADASVSIPPFPEMTVDERSGETHILDRSTQ